MPVNDTVTISINYVTVRLESNHFICFQGVEQQGFNMEHKNDGDVNQSDRVPGQAEDEFSDEDQMVG
jgi:hypothetical protein